MQSGSWVKVKSKWGRQRRHFALKRNTDATHFVSAHGQALWRLELGREAKP
jgi:hypothetical protein